MFCMSLKGSAEILIRRAVESYKKGNFKDAAEEASNAVQFAKMAAEEEAKRNR